MSLNLSNLYKIHKISTCQNWWSYKKKTSKTLWTITGSMREKNCLGRELVINSIDWEEPREFLQREPHWACYPGAGIWIPILILQLVLYISEPSLQVQDCFIVISLLFITVVTLVFQTNTFILSFTVHLLHTYICFCIWRAFLVGSIMLDPFWKNNSQYQFLSFDWHLWPRKDHKGRYWYADINP